ncbi:glutamate--cysteine ligase [Thalassotalea ponticola]|uniref:glutamate--cysteine ligase n=1 Tax=Thalassotalea ponticola TaxID=1523392 RepID=UPI0025B4F239|nr:glutamate--cysteine ligase [Thalassotalea ponticola]MDN3653912.1 glutamate--cysteine ligase [Thalassotalea ponticola]
MALTIEDLTSALSESTLNSLTSIKRGVERETLRVQHNGKLSTQPHNVALGSALTHDFITTDYSESLLEFITPATSSIDATLAQLKDIQKFTLANIDGDWFWPMSMPCVVESEDQIQLAQYGSSNIGRMKTVYRQGLKNRYGSMMQVIAGIHFNFSLPPAFFQQLQTLVNDTQPLQDFISERYFGLIRNYKRFGWLIPYLFGSSPAVCPSFLNGRETPFDFSKTAQGCLYMEYATSLRMSDLGYTSSAQSALSICNNSLQSYVDSVQQAMNLPSDEFAKIGVKVDGEYQQLNSNVLQIENELYASIRPKRVAKSGQKPSQALQQGGVEYIEVRAMDVNPFVSTGIDKQQMLFLDVFLTYCTLEDSPATDVSEMRTFIENTDAVILQGRKPGLLLNDRGIEKTIIQWGGEVFAKLQMVASLFDSAFETTDYSQAVSGELDKIHDVNKTPSARILADLITGKENIVSWSLAKAKRYVDEITDHQYQQFSEADFQHMAQQSIAKQRQIEAADTLSFDQFLAQYFAK